jgi:beta-mannosidase
MMRPIVAGLFATYVYAQSIHKLSDVAWTVSNGVNATVPGHFPSQAHVDLLAAGVIEEPTYGFNDINQLWVQRSNWTWTSKPVTGLDKTKNPKTWLVFEGLGKIGMRSRVLPRGFIDIDVDTFAEIKMCNTTVANVNNQYRGFTFDVTAILSKCSGDPILSLNFGSASKIVNEIARIGPGEKRSGPLSSVMRTDILVLSRVGYINSTNSCKGREFDGKVYMRKQQNDFGWDWGPALGPAGPWRPAYVVQKKSQDPVFIHNTLIDIYRQGQRNNLSPDQNKPWIFNASIDFLGALPSDAKLQLKLEDPSGKLVKQVMLRDITRNDMTVRIFPLFWEPR